MYTAIMIKQVMYTPPFLLTEFNKGIVLNKNIKTNKVFSFSVKELVENT